MAQQAAREPGAKTSTLDLSWMIAASIAVVAPVFGTVMGLYLALHRTVGLDDGVRPALDNQDSSTVITGFLEYQHATFALGVTVVVFGLLVGALAAVVAIGVHTQVAPRLYAQRLAAYRADAAS